MGARTHSIIVIGTSAGGLEALDRLVGELPAGLRAAIFIVQHMASDSTGEPLVRRLSRHRAFHPQLAKNGQRFKAGHIYIAPPDSHLLVKTDRMLVTKGATENRQRPGIDPLFRSAAVAHGARVIGVVLTGMLDDGTAGLLAIKRCGGMAVVQDPTDAAYSGMPMSAVANVKVDFCVPLAAMGALLATLVAQPRGIRKPVPRDVRIEAEIAERVLSDVSQVNGLGAQVPYNCPGCGGVLWEMDTPGGTRYRCHTGHAYTAATLLASQSEKIQEMLWISLRMFEERKNLLTSMARRSGKVARAGAARRIKETQGFIDRIRGLLLDPGTTGADDTLTQVKALMAQPRRARSTR
jgi:two-component system chemotaxis response regulator CheB